MSRTKLPVEQQSYLLHFFIGSVLFLAVTAWAIYDEVETRRPWKSVQERFIELDIARATEEVERAKQKLDEPKLRAEIDEARQKLASARERVAKSGDQLTELRAAVKLEEVALQEVSQELNFAKSERDEAYYFYQHDFNAGVTTSVWKDTYFEHKESVAEMSKRVAAQQAKLDSANEHLNELMGEIPKLTKWLEEQERGVSRTKRLLKMAKQQTVGIRQVVVSDLKVVDRCQTCHLAIDRPGFEDAEKYPQPYRTHPHLDELIKDKHPVQRFGCTPCHHGQGSQVKGVSHHEFDHGRDDHYWETPLLRGPFLQSSCPSCHQEQPNLKHAPVLNEGKRLFKVNNCWACHDAPGFVDLPKPGPPLNYARQKYQVGWLASWIANPRSMRPFTRMPNFWPDALDASGNPDKGSEAYDRREREVTRIIAYLWSISEPAADAADAEGEAGHASGEVNGEELLEEKGCRGCHLLGGESVLSKGAVAYYKGYAPELTDLGSKTNERWITQWVRNPQAFWSRTRMPNLRLDAAEAAAVARTVLNLTKKREYPVPAELEQTLAGAVLDGGPLRGADKLESLAEEGRKLIKRYGCYACHDIKGFEKGLKPGVPLQDFGVKLTERLDYGNVITDPDKQTWIAWVEHKLRAPRSFQTEKIELRMPHFTLANDEIEALAVLLKSFVQVPMPLRALRRLSPREEERLVGEQIVERYGCRGCHVLGPDTGFIREYYKKRGLDVAFAPPSLVGEGRKVAPDWLYRFLHRPVTLRPWLKIRMPTFGMTATERTGLVEYFLAAADVKDRLYASPVQPMSPDRLKLAESAFGELKCLMCHSLTGPSAAKPAGTPRTEDGNTEGEDEAPAPAVKAGELAPDLSLARRRLRYEWVVDWLEDPQKLQPGTRMPTFFPLEDDEDPKSITSPLEILDGDALKQIELLAEYLHQEK